MVQFLKVLLPLAAILVLSTVFLLSRSINPSDSIPFTQQDIDERLEGQVVTNPHFRGTTSKGEEIEIEAGKVRQGRAETGATTASLNGYYRLLNGREITLESNSGSIRPDKGMATFAGNVVMITSDGMQVTTELLNTSLDEIRGNTPGQIEGQGPIGNFSAGRMTFGEEKRGGPVHILFTDGVKLIYEPQKTER